MTAMDDGPAWRFLEQPEKPPAPFGKEELELSTAWLRLQILHTPFRAIEQRDYRWLADWLIGLERYFLEHEGLEPYYHECFERETPTMGPAVVEVPRSDYAAEIDHMAASQVRFMEQAYFVLQLERYANAPDNRSWMNLFRRWGRSPTFNRAVDRLRSVSTLDFLEFYDWYLRHYSRRIDEDPVPHPWDADPRREDRREPEHRPPRQTGGDSGPIKMEVSLSPADLAKLREEPEARLLPGLFLDPGVQELQRGSTRRGKRPVKEEGGEGAHGIRGAEGGPGPAQGGDAGPGGSAADKPNE